jgi:hypothetical protein
MSLNVSADLFYGVELNFPMTDEMDEDYERYENESVYSRHIMRSLGLEIPEEFDEESLSDATGLKVIDTEGALFLVAESTLNEVRGNGITQVKVNKPPWSVEKTLHAAIEAIGNSRTDPKWLMATNYS